MWIGPLPEQAHGSRWQLGKRGYLVPGRRLAGDPRPRNDATYHCLATTHATLMPSDHVRNCQGRLCMSTVGNARPQFHPSSFGTKRIGAPRTRLCSWLGKWLWKTHNGSAHFKNSITPHAFALLGACPLLLICFCFFLCVCVCACAGVRV